MKVAVLDAADATVAWRGANASPNSRTILSPKVGQSAAGRSYELKKSSAGSEFVFI